MKLFISRCDERNPRQPAYTRHQAIGLSKAIEAACNAYLPGSVYLMLMPWGKMSSYWVVRNNDKNYLPASDGSRLLPVTGECMGCRALLADDERYCDNCV
jgi:hypothetical protein